tara:strand:+ start:6533 stop:6718 length:186 start_codon:yes stop_codon:yes gene_type:complete
MPLTWEDSRTLSPAAIALSRALSDALSPDGDGGKQVTRAEGKRILSTLGQLLVVLVKDLVD